MTVSIKELYEKRGKVWADTQKIKAKAVAENRELRPHEAEDIDRGLYKVDALTRDIERAEADAKSPRPMSIRDSIGRSGDQSSTGSYERRAFEQYLRNGEREHRALGVGTTNGVLAPDEVSNDYVEVLKDFSGMLDVATLRQTAGFGPFPLPVFDNSSNEADTRAEHSQITDFASPAVSDKSLGAFTYASDIYKLSRQLAASADVDVISYIGLAVGQSVSRKLNKDMTVGDGSGKATGILHASLGAMDSEVETDSDEAVTYGELLDLQHSVDVAYRKDGRGRWMLHDSALKKIMGMTDLQNRPLWVPQDGTRPGRILGHEYVVNNDMPVFETGNKSIIFGDLSRYWVRMTRGVEILRLSERYADSLELGFLGYVGCDGKLADRNSCKFLTVGGE
ncbi:phage major capsid protein [Phycisphaerales bacterium AB-hyl4]|uniref:Phage major capsid protein n=1 Tax=Natronomicrosphaera hydrolytica TaxID=3242702 RepID=A0ABV4U204_9BACT